MKTFIQPGLSIPLTAPTGGVTAGVALMVGALIVIPSNTTDEGKTFNGNVNGAYTVDKTTGEVWAEGDIVYFDVSAAEFTKTASTNFKAGVAIAPAITGAVEGDIRLDGVSSVVEA